MSHQYLDKSDIKGQNLLNKTKNYFVSKFNQIGKVFSYSSSLGQIFLSISNHSKIVFFYIKDSINETSFKTARRKDSIFGMAQLQGHNAHRGFGATGSVSLSPKKDASNISIPKKLFLPNFSRIICKDNNILYYASLGKEFLEYDTSSGDVLTFAVNQGEIRVQSFIGNGEDNQMYSTNENNANIDMNHILVEVNGEQYAVKNSFSEFVYGEKSCIVRTGLTSGIDVIFGKSVYANVPQKGSSIKVFYPVIAGSQGNRNYGKFEFVDPMFDASGENYNIPDLFEMTIINEFAFGSDAEQMEMTKLIAPNVNRNRIIHDVKSVKYFFEKTGLFAKVDVFNDEDASQMATYLYPNLEDKIETGSDIFSMHKNNILLDEKTKDRLTNWINTNKSQSIDVRIEDPIIKQYSINLTFGVPLSDKNTIDLDEFKKEKRQLLNTGLSKFENTNRISKSDIIKMVVGDVESVNVYFDMEEKEMLNELGDIVVGNKEIALPIAPFVSYSGEDISSSLVMKIVFI